MSDLERGDVQTGGAHTGLEADPLVNGGGVGAAPTAPGARPPVGTTGGPTGSGGGDDKKEMAKEQASQAAGEAKDVARTASEQSKQVAGTAAEGAREVAHEAGEQASRVANEAILEVNHLVGEATNELRSQVHAQGDRAASGLHTLASQLNALAEGRPEEAGPAADYARQLTTRIDDLANRLEQRGVDGMAQDVQRFARRRPGAFLAGAAAAGFLASRLFRGNQAAQQGSGGGGVDRTRDIDLRPQTTRVPTVTGSMGDELPASVPATPMATDPDAQRPYGGI